MTTHPIGTAIVFTLATPPASKKNGRRWLKRGGRTFLVPSVKAVASSDDIMIAAHRAMTKARLTMFGPNDALRIYYKHDIEHDLVTVCVQKIGTLPTNGKRGTKRDCHGMIETIADALQGVVYPNDSQLDAGGWERVRT